MGCLLLWCAVRVDQYVLAASMQGHDVVDDEGHGVCVRQCVVDGLAADTAVGVVFGDGLAVPVSDGGVAWRGYHQRYGLQVGDWCGDGG